jgi:cell wall-associated NlpC family hydrolase
MHTALLPKLRLPAMAAVLLIGFTATQCTTTLKTAKSPAPLESREMRLRNDIVDFAEKYKGYDYTYAGKKPETGFDCSGFTSYVMDHFDIDLSPSSSLQSKQGDKKSLGDAKPGDLVFFRRTPGGDVFHVALVVDTRPGELWVIHATTSRGVIKEDINRSSYWKEKHWEVRDVISK